MSDSDQHAAAPAAAPAVVAERAPAPHQPPSRGTQIAVRVGFGLAILGGIAWFVVDRTKPKRPTAPEGAPPAAAGGGGGGGAKAGPGGGSGERVVPVQVAEAKKEDLPIWLEGLGSVAAFQQVTVKAQVDGRLDSVAFTEGQTVKKGDLLAQIDPRPFMVQLHQAEGALARDKAQLVANQATLERDKTLKAQNLIAQAEVDAAQGAVGQNQGAIMIDQASIENARLQLDYATIRAPLDGVVGVRLVDAGNIVHASDANGIVVITAVNPAAVIFTVPQDRLPQVNAALSKGKVPVEVYNRDGQTKLADATLAVLDNQINASTATLKLKAIADNPDRALWPNAFVKARMLIEKKQGVLVVPAVAIQRGPQGTYVYVVDKDSTAQMKPVVVALQTGDRAVIEKGLDGGEQVVIEGHNQLRPGGKVAIAKPDGGGAPAGPGGPGAGSGSGGGGRHKKPQ